MISFSEIVWENLFLLDGFYSTILSDICFSYGLFYLIMLLFHSQRTV